MPTVDVRTAGGAAAGSIELDESLFGVQPNVPVMHQVVTAQLAAARRGTQSTRTRAEVSGGGAKPYRQKGTGRARQGSTRAPHWQGGGVALGPKPRSYRQRTPKKMIRLALASALSDRVVGGKVVIVDQWPFEGPRTKHAIDALDALGLAGRVVVVVAPDDEFAIKSFRNLEDVHLLVSTELNAYDVLCSDWLVFTLDVLPGANGEVVGAPAAPPVVDEPEADEEPADEADDIDEADDVVDEADDGADEAHDEEDPESDDEEDDEEGDA
jgi:large subunit ribosomal protein L4